MKRIWSIEEQVFNDPASGLGFEFTSPGSTDPDHPTDGEVVFKLHNQARGMVLVITFDRNGQKMTSDVVNLTAGPAPDDAFEPMPVPDVKPELPVTDPPLSDPPPVHTAPPASGGMSGIGGENVLGKSVAF
jgi:hypothetical protein